MTLHVGERQRPPNVILQPLRDFYAAYVHGQRVMRTSFSDEDAVTGPQVSDGCSPAGKLLPVALEAREKDGKRSQWNSRREFSADFAEGLGIGDDQRRRLIQPTERFPQPVLLDH